MKHFELQSNEVILYRGQVNLLPDGKPEKPSAFRKAETDVILTNLNLVIDTLTKKFFGKSIDTYLYDVKTIKVYQGVPQVIQKGVYVDVYLVGKELFLQFPSKKDAALFNNAALRLLTGQSKLVRGVKKAQKAVHETEDQLDIDITGTVKKAAVVATEVAINAATNSTNNKAKTFAQFASGIFKKKEKKEQILALTESNMKQLSDAKDMLDKGIITQKEFDEIKNQILEK